MERPGDFVSTDDAPLKTRGTGSMTNKQLR